MGYLIPPGATGTRVSTKSCPEGLSRQGRASGQVPGQGTTAGMVTLHSQAPPRLEAWNHVCPVVSGFADHASTFLPTPGDSEMHQNDS